MLITSGAGPGLDPDSMSYVGAATSLAHRGTLTVPSNSWDADDSTAALTVWPPGFSTAMAIPQKLGASRLMSARLVMALAALVTATILFLLIESAAGSLAAIAGVATVFATPAIVGVHLSVLSEPLFLACLLLTVWAMLRRPRRPSIAGIAAAATVMVRYAGVCAPIAVVLWFFFSDNKPLRQRFTDAAKAAIAPAIAIGAWVIRGALLSNAQGGMEIRVYGHFGPTFREGLSTIVDWLAPTLEATALRGVVAIAMAAAIGFVIFKSARTIRNREQTSDFLKADLLMLCCYIGTLITARTFVGDAIPFDFRILAPAILLAEAAIVVVLARSLSRAGKPLRIAAATLAALWLIASISVSTESVVDSITDGLDFSSSDWRASPTVQWVKTQGKAWTIFTNWPPAIYFMTGRVSRDIPQSLDPAELREFGETLHDQHGVFIAFSSYNTDYPPSDSIARGAGLVEARQFSDGKIWVSPGEHP